jgi:hypothetical protein
MIAAPDSKGEKKKQKPRAVMDYSNSKSDVNTSDQMLSYYSFERKSVKW